MPTLDAVLALCALAGAASCLLVSLRGFARLLTGARGTPPCGKQPPVPDQRATPQRGWPWVVEASTAPYRGLGSPWGLVLALVVACAGG